MNAEQSVLDAIAQLEAEEHPDEIHELVDWQLEEGRRRGDGPASTFTPPIATGSLGVGSAWPGMALTGAGLIPSTVY